MEFNLAEKLAIVKAIDKVILADSNIASGEMVYLGQLMKILDFNSALVEEARKFNVKQSNAILTGMSEPKKHSLAIMLHEMAYADGDMHMEEIKVLFSIFEGVGIKIEQADKSIRIFDISDIYFRSTRQLYIETIKNSEIIRNDKKAIKIEPHINGKEGYSVTIFKLNGFLPFWGNKAEMAPLQMNVVAPDKNRTSLKGYRDYNSTTNCEDYSLNIFHPNNEIEKIVLHNHSQNKDIEYLK